MGVSLDIRKAHSARLTGDIVHILTWMNDERALILMPAVRKGAPWFVIMESSAWRYADMSYLVKQAIKAAEVLGMDETNSTYKRIASIIEDELADLIRMPSSPPAEFHPQVFGEMLLRADGQTLSGKEIRVEKEGATYV